jgi:uncharacterized Zn finger protein (UPF0148 family)
MKLCPNCTTPFEEKAGRLFCPDHGWHKLNDSGEIIPADPPTSAELAEYEKNQSRPENTPAAEKKSLQDDPGSMIDPGSDAETPPIEEGGGMALHVSENTLLIAAAIIGAGLIGYAVYKRVQQRRAAQR